jgi:hypothetical protein
MPEKLTRCRFRGKRSNHGPANREMHFRSYFTSPFFIEIVFSVWTIHLEGEELKVVELGHTDTKHTTALHVPSIALVISGDAVYNNTYAYLAECDEQARGEWLRALDKIEALHARAVVAGHGVLDPDSSPHHIGETRNYIRDFNTSVTSTSTAMELYETMLTLHPNRVNPGSLWGTAKAVKPS